MKEQFNTDLCKAGAIKYKSEAEDVSFRVMAGKYQTCTTWEKRKIVS